MKIECERCKGTAIIYSRKKQSDTLSALYCCCKNPKCGHSFVMDLAFSRTISPSLLDFPPGIRDRIENLSKIELRKLLASLDTVNA